MMDIPDTAGPWPGWAPGDPLPPSSAPSSLRAELAEARAEIARLTDESAELEDLVVKLRIREIKNAPIVEAATALAEFWRDQVPLEYCHDPVQDRLTDALIAAVEEGERT